ncbi:MAG TPA: NAD(P)-dependent oxidoreductase [Candidatus Nanoarchaeia archaeon]|nr:NAD(P)-dependent oxidoreductase [Candidatus Nanoarchaeia archaeon]
MIKNILLTGATGFIGSHILELLLEKGYNVILIYNSSSDFWRIKESIDAHSKDERIKSYNLGKTGIDEIFNDNKIDCVIHLAAYYRREHSREDIGRFIDSIIRLPTLILENMAKHDVKFFINTGTFFEYKGSGKPLDEDSVKEAYDLYAAFKTSFSEVLKYYSANHGIAVADLKLFAPYGPKDNKKLISYLMKNALDGTEFTISKSKLEWDWTYVKDIADAYLLAISYLDKRKKGYEVFNIGNSSAVKIKEMISILEGISGRNMRVSYLKNTIKDSMFYANCDNSKAIKILGWKPAYDMKKGLEETYKYYAEDRRNGRKGYKQH